MRVRMLSSVLVILSVGALAACTPLPPAPSSGSALAAERSPPSSGSDAVATGQRALAARDFGVARQAFSAAANANPNDVDAALGLAETSLALGELQTAERLFAPLMRSASGGRRGRVLQGMGLIALRSNQMAEARGHLAAAVDADATLWRAWLGLGRAHAALGEETSALTAFARAEAVAPREASVSNDIGMFYLASDAPLEAITHFERALLLDPGHALARGNLRIAQALNRHYDVAVAGAAPSELADALNNAGYAAVLNGDLEMADTLLRRALEVSPVFHDRATANLDLLAQVQQDSLARGAPRLAGTVGTAVAAQPLQPDMAARQAVETAGIASGAEAVQRREADVASRVGDGVVPDVPTVRPETDAPQVAWLGGLEQQRAHRRDR